MFSKQVINEVNEILKNNQPVDLTKKPVFITNLVLIYQLIKASERLLKEAAQDADGELKAYYESHLKEEENHEKWLAEDLAHAGVNVEDVIEIRLAIEMAGSMYYRIKHISPECLLGYMAVLEGLPFDIKTIETLEKIHGPELVRTLKYHSIHDLEHRKDLFKVIDKLGTEHTLNTAKQTARFINETTKFINSCHG